MKILFHIGHYTLFLKKVFDKPERRSVYWSLFLDEIVKLGIGSIGIIIIISGFMGMVITIQTASQIDASYIPVYLVGWTTRQSVILEFSTTMLALILAGKIGSNIASELGTMKVTEQIDALEIMGINSASFLILPKIIAAMFFFPILIILSITIGIIGGWLGGLSMQIPTADFVYGLQYQFIPFYVTYSLIKTVVFAFLITSISAFYGYTTKGGAINVGKSSTLAVVYSSILLLIFNFILTDLILS